MNAIDAHLVEPIVERQAHVRCSECPIRERAVCAYCEPPELVRLDAIKSYRTFEAGQDILSAGEPVGHVASIVTGIVKLTKTLADGRTQMVGLLFPSDFVGQIKQEYAQYDATAATDVLLCTFQRRTFLTILNETPHLERRLLDMTLNELDAARDWLLLLGRKTAREKVASFLMLLARNRSHDGDGEGVTVALPLKRAEIAEYLGLTLETVSRQISRFRSEGLVRSDAGRSLIIPNLARLEAAAESG